MKHLILFFTLAIATNITFAAATKIVVPKATITTTSMVIKDTVVLHLISSDTTAQVVVTLKNLTTNVPQTHTFNYFTGRNDTVAGSWTVTGLTAATPYSVWVTVTTIPNANTVTATPFTVSTDTVFSAPTSTGIDSINATTTSLNIFFPFTSGNDTVHAVVNVNQFGTSLYATQSHTYASNQNYGSFLVNGLQDSTDYVVTVTIKNRMGTYSLPIWVYYTRHLSGIVTPVVMTDSAHHAAHMITVYGSTNFSSSNKGFLMSTNRTAVMNHTAMGYVASGGNTFSITRTSLQRATKYYFVAYAQQSVNTTYYGSVDSVTTDNVAQPTLSIATTHVGTNDASFLVLCTGAGVYGVNMISATQSVAGNPQNITTTTYTVTGLHDTTTYQCYPWTIVNGGADTFYYTPFTVITRDTATAVTPTLPQINFVGPARVVKINQSQYEIVIVFQSWSASSYTLMSDISPDGWTTVYGAGVVSGNVKTVPAGLVTDSFVVVGVAGAFIDSAYYAYDLTVLMPPFPPQYLYNPYDGSWFQVGVNQSTTGVVDISTCTKVFRVESQGIKIPCELDENKIIFYNMSGQVIDVSQSPAGIYVYNYQYKNKNYSGKVVK